MKKISITHFDNNHNDWLRSLDFYKDELGILKVRLTEIAGKNTDKEALSQVEHYENQFAVQQENIDSLAHDIRHNLMAISEQARSSSAGYIDEQLLALHDTLHYKFETAEKIINELRHEFNKFATSWM